MSDVRPIDLSVIRHLRVVHARFLAVATCIWLAVAIPFITDVATPFPVDIGLAAVWLALGGTWLILGYAERRGFQSRSWRRWWLAAGIAGLTGFALAFTDLGLMVRLILCERQMAAFVADVAPDRQMQLDPPVAVGLFRVSQVESYQGTVTVYTSHGFLNEYGLAYVQPGGSMPPRTGTLHHLYGPWYTFEWRF